MRLVAPMFDRDLHCVNNMKDVTRRSPNTRIKRIKLHAYVFRKEMKRKE